MGITEVKREDIPAGAAQNMVQIESVTTEKQHRADLMDDMNARSWLFLEHTRSDGIIKFKLSEEYYVPPQPRGNGSLC